MRVTRNITHLLIGVVGIGAVGWYTNVFFPTSPTSIAIFFLLLGSTIGSLLLYLYGNMRRSLLLTAGIIIFLLLRYFGLRQPLYPILLAASILCIEWISTRR
jgi:hypothetical protein